MSESLNLKAGLIVQGYLLELLLLNFVSRTAAPSATLEHIRFQLRTQLADDLQRGLQGQPPHGQDSAAWQAALDVALSAALDRVAGQLLADAPPKHQA